MAKDNRDPEFSGLMDFDTFFDEVESRFGDDGFEAIKSIAKEIDLANSGAAAVVDLRKRRDGRYNLFHKLNDGTRVVVVLSRKPDGRYFAQEGGFLWT